MDISSLTEEQKAELKKTYEGRLEESGCTGLSQQQAREALCLLGLNPSGLDISKFWIDLEKQESETVNLDEFIKLRCFVDEDPETVLRWAFNKFDTNNDGTIDRTELKKILVMVYNDTEGEFVDETFVDDVLKLADENGDGVLQIEEFVDMLLARTSSPQSKVSS